MIGAGVLAVGGANLLDSPDIDRELTQAASIKPQLVEPIEQALTVADVERLLSERILTNRLSAEPKKTVKTLIRGDDIDRLNIIVREVGGYAADIYGPPLPRSAKYPDVVKRLTKLMGALNELRRLNLAAAEQLKKQSVRGKRRLDQFIAQ